MSEGKQIRCTPWEEIRCDYDMCRKCRMEGKYFSGTMMRRRVTGRDDESHVEYKIVCKSCKQDSSVYRSPRLAAIAWRAKQTPDEDPRLKHRNRKPAEVSK